MGTKALTKDTNRFKGVAFGQKQLKSAKNGDNRLFLKYHSDQENKKLQKIFWTVWILQKLRECIFAFSECFQIKKTQFFHQSHISFLHKLLNPESAVDVSPSLLPSKSPQGIFFVWFALNRRWLTANPPIIMGAVENAWLLSFLHNRRKKILLRHAMWLTTNSKSQNCFALYWHWSFLLRDDGAKVRRWPSKSEVWGS